MDEVDFTDDEICKELADLGYTNIPAERFQQFKNELFGLIRQERSHNGSVTSIDSSLSYAGPVQPQHEDKENVVNRPNARPSEGRISVRNDDDRPPPPDGRLCRATDGQDIKTSKVNHHIPRSLEEPHQGHGVMKRKVLRKVDGHVSISESFTESEVDDLTELRERLRSTAISSHCRPLSAPPDVRHSVCTTTDHCLEQHRRPHTACREPSLYNLPEDYQGPKALIRPMSCDPHIRNIKKNDPVARYQEYQHCWTACRAPGEKAHKQLRWGVREKMLYHDQVVEKKPQRSYQPNTYVVPSDKKRKTLRWQIRMDLAQGVKPPSAFD